MVLSPIKQRLLNAIMKLSITCSALVGRLPKLVNLKLLTQDPWVLQVVKGYQIEFITIHSAAICTFRDTHFGGKTLLDSVGSD